MWFQFSWLLHREADYQFYCNQTGRKCTSVYKKVLLNQGFVLFQTPDFIDSSFNHILTKNNAEAISKWDVLGQGWPSWYAVLMFVTSCPGSYIKLKRHLWCFYASHFTWHKNKAIVTLSDLEIILLKTNAFIASMHTGLGLWAKTWDFEVYLIKCFCSRK